MKIYLITMMVCLFSVASTRMEAQRTTVTDVLKVKTSMKLGNKTITDFNDFYNQEATPGGTLHLNDLWFRPSTSVFSVFDGTAWVQVSTAGVGISDGDKQDITVSSNGTTWTIDDGVVTLSKMANGTPDRLIGYDASGNPAEITLAGGATLDGGVLDVTPAPARRNFCMAGTGQSLNVNRDGTPGGWTFALDSLFFAVQLDGSYQVANPDSNNLNLFDKAPDTVKNHIIFATGNAFRETEPDIDTIWGGSVGKGGYESAYWTPELEPWNTSNQMLTKCNELFDVMPAPVDLVVYSQGENDTLYHLFSQRMRNIYDAFAEHGNVRDDFTMVITYPDCDNPGSDSLRVVLDSIFRGQIDFGGRKVRAAVYCEQGFDNIHLDNEDYDRTGRHVKHAYDTPPSLESSFAAGKRVDAEVDGIISQNDTVTVTKDLVIDNSQAGLSFHNIGNGSGTIEYHPGSSVDMVYMRGWNFAGTHPGFELRSAGSAEQALVLALDPDSANGYESLTIEVNGSTRFQFNRFGFLSIGPSTAAYPLDLQDFTSGIRIPSGITDPVGNTGVFRYYTPDDRFRGYNGATGLFENIPFMGDLDAYALDDDLAASAALDFASTAAQSETELTVSAAGATVGDAVTLGIPDSAASAGGTYTSWVSSAGTVTVRFSNPTAAAIDPASGLFKVVVIK